MMCNDISTKRCSAHFFLTTAVLKRTSGFHSRFRYMFATCMPYSLLHPTILCSHYEHSSLIPTDKRFTGTFAAHT